LRLQLVSQHATLLDLMSRFEASARRFQEAIALADALPAPLWQRAELRSSLAYTLFQAGQPDRAQALNAVALPMAHESGDHRALSTIYTMEAILHGDGSLAESRPAEEQAMRAALEHAQLAGSASDEALTTANLADLSLRNGDYAQAIAYAERALALARELRDATAESVALVNAGLGRLMLGQKAEGQRLVALGLAVDERSGNQAQQAATLRELGHYLEKAGYPGEAYAAYQQHRHLAEAVFRSDLQRQLAEMQEAFDHQSRRREMDLLEREGRIQQAQLVSRQLQMWLWAGGALTGALLLALGALLLRRVRAGNRALAQTNAQLAELSERDVLTGLANRHGFQAALPAGARIDGTLMLIDIDHFKQINDGWGHAAGDEVLIEVARRLRSAVRDDDLVVRWGGEEFLVWVRGPAAADPEAVVARTLAAIADTPVAVGRDRIPVSASIGFATFPLEPARAVLQWEPALELIDTAMYLAKAHGRNRAYGVRRAQADSLPALAALVRKLEAAWREGRVELVAIDGPTPAAPSAVAPTGLTPARAPA
jgi:diguanylate cyclase (GGDEF)-like protein